jgi:hypothetical protein
MICIIHKNTNISQGEFMTDLEELIATADKLCATLEKAANDEKRFCADLCLKFEVMSWEAWRSANDLREAINRWS